MKKVSKINNIYSSACICCGKLLKEVEEIKINGKNYCEACSVLKDKNNIFEFNVPEGVLRVLSYIFSFINPFIGFLLGAIFYSQKQNLNARKFGKNCLILMAISLSLIFLFFIFAIILGSVLSDGSLFYNIKEGYY